MNKNNRNRFIKSIKFTLIFLIISLNILNLQVQKGFANSSQKTPIFMHTWGGSSDDKGYRLWKDTTNIYTVGITDSYGQGETDLAIIKWDLQGNKIWNTTWGTSEIDKGYAIWGNEENIFISGLTTGKGAGNEDLLLIKYDKDGNEIWNVTWGGIAYEEGSSLWGNSEYIYCIASTFSFGAGNEDMALIQWDLDGNKINNITWGGIGDDWCAEIWGNSEALFMAGYTSSFGMGDKDMVLLKYDLDCNYQWNVTWGGFGEDIGYGLWCNSSELYITGWTNSYDALAIDAFVVKYDFEGEQIWNRTWGMYNNDYGYGITGDSGCIYITGPSWSYTQGLNDVFIARWNSDGDLLWETLWGGNQREWGYDICIHNSVIYCLGTTNTYGNGLYDMLFLAWDVGTPLIVEIPENISDFEDYSDLILTWIAMDPNPSTYIIEIDGIEVVGATAWTNGTAISYDILDGLLEGDYNITIIISDEGGNIAQDTVIFTVHDGEAPQFTDIPVDFSADEGYSGLNISWTTTDLHPATYIIELDGIKVVTATAWTSETAILYDIPDGLLEGDHNITIIVTDESGNIAQDTVIFTVNSNIIPGFPLVYLLIFISIGVFMQRRKINNRKIRK